MPRLQNSNSNKLDSIEHQMVNIFVDGARILGLPPSIGEIYGLLFISPTPLALDDFVARLGISKGSVSQGLKFLRDQGMVLSVKAPGSRRERWQPTPSLAASLVTLLRSQVLPALEQSSPSLDRIVQGAQGTQASPAVIERLTQLRRWNARALELFPLMLPPPRES